MSASILDPVCDMIVDIANARDDGLTLERPEREYAFCSAGCLARFAKAPQQYIPKVEAWLARPGPSGAGHAVAELAIDAGVRAWYASCRCCLSDAHPEVVARLDEERKAMSHEPSGPGICDVAEAQTTKHSGV